MEKFNLGGQNNDTEDEDAETNDGETDDEESEETDDSLSLLTGNNGEGGSNSKLNSALFSESRLSVD